MRLFYMQRLHYHYLFFLSLALIGYLYSQGLSSALLLDDIGNLRQLAQLKSHPSTEEFLGFIFHNMDTSSGRPISFLSFALQANSWPNGTAFKAVNIALHLLNGVLIYFLAQFILRKAQYKYIEQLSVGVALLWLVAPIQVDTVQYVIQRMSILSTLFILLGLITYIKLQDQKTTPFWLYSFFIFCLIAGIFSKENGLLLTTFVLLFEFSLFRNTPKPPFYKLWFFIAIILPILLFFTYMAYRYQSFFLYTYRGFDAYERVLTQAHVVSHYLSAITAPSTQKLTLFYENFPISRSIFDISTILFILMHCILLLCGLLSLKKYPLIGLGILFFYLSHLMESTFLQLELYFEHRNYLAIFGFSMAFFGVIYHLSHFVHSKQVKIIILSTPVFFILVSGWVNFQQNVIWANPLYQANNWYTKNPKSQRAHGHLGVTLTKHRLFNEAAQHYKTSLEQFPGDPTKTMLWLEVTCFSSNAPVPSPKEVLNRAEHGRYYKEVTAIIFDFVKAFELGLCNNITHHYFIDILEHFLKNPRYQGIHRQNLLVSKYRLLQLNNDYLTAAQALESAIEINIRHDLLIGLVEKYILLNMYDKAKERMEDLKLYCTKHQFKCYRQATDIEYLQKQLINNK